MSESLFLRLNLKALSFSGFWISSNSPTKRVVLYILNNFLIAFMTVSLVCDFIEVYLLRNHLIMLIQNLTCSLLHVIICAKLYTLKLNKKLIDKLLNALKWEELQALKGDETQVSKYMNDVHQNWIVLRNFTIIVFVGFMVFLIGRPIEYWYFGPEETYHNKVPFLTSDWTPYDRYATGFYEFTYVRQTFLSVITCYFVITVDTFIYNCTNFPISQLQILQYKIKNLCNTSNQFDLCGLKNPYADVVRIVNHHCRIIKYVETMDIWFRPMMFVTFLTTIIMLCCIGLEGILAGYNPRSLVSIYYLSAVLVELFLYCWFVNQLTLESSNVIDAISESKWYQYSYQIRRVFILIMLRAKRPLYLTVGGFSPLSLQTYLTIIKTSYSCLVVFHRAYIRQKDFEIKT